MITTESLLVSPDAFGITTATVAQRAACRVLDGRPLGDLRDHPDALELVGGAEALASLPSEHGVMPREVCFLASVRSAKTMIACAVAIRASQSVDVSGLRHGEVPRVSIVSLKLDTSAVARSILAGTISASRLLRPLLLDDSGESVVLRHPTGRPVEITCVAGARAGGGLVARWSAGAIFDEAPRMSGADDAVVNLDHARSAVLGRLLPGAQALYIGSAWAPVGPVYEIVSECWRRPSERMVVLRGSGPLLNPTWWTPARCADLEARDPVAYQTDVMGEFADPESGLCSPFAVRTHRRESPLELPPVQGAAYCAAIDPSGGGAAGNAFSLVIVRRTDARDESGEMRTRFQVVLAREWRGMSPERCLEQIATTVERYGLRRVYTDQFSGSALVDLAKRYRLGLVVQNASASSKLTDYTDFATRLHAGEIELSPEPQLIRDILAIRKRITQQGASIVLPRTSDGRHCDFAPALVSAIKNAPQRFSGSPFGAPGRGSEGGSRWADYSSSRGFG